MIIIVNALLKFVIHFFGRPLKYPCCKFGGLLYKALDSNLFNLSLFCSFSSPMIFWIVFQMKCNAIIAFTPIFPHNSFGSTFYPCQMLKESVWYISLLIASWNGFYAREWMTYLCMRQSDFDFISGPFLQVFIFTVRKWAEISKF